MSTAIQTNAYNVPLEEVKVARMVIPAAQAVVASTSGIMAARAATGPCSCTLIAASADSDTLTITFPAASANAPVGVLTVTLDAASDDNLAVSASDTTGVITILLAKDTATKNTATLIQAAIRGVTPSGGAAGVVKGVSVAGVICTAAGNWNTAAVAEKAGGSMTGVAFAGGAGETITPNVSILFAQPPCCRTITATSGGTGANIGPVRVIVYGTNIDGQVISESLPVFTENSATTVTSTKAFKTITSVFLPSHDGTGATVALGYSEALGVPFMFAKKPYLRATLNGVIEANAPTQVNDADELEKNTVDINSTLNGTEVCLYWFLP
jgi:hypothetical protein